MNRLRDPNLIRISCPTPPYDLPYYPDLTNGILWSLNNYVLGTKYKSL